MSPMFTKKPRIKKMRVAKILKEYTDGDEDGWDAEFAWIHEHHVDHLYDLTEDIKQYGIIHPILLGNDGRIWDGHHRLCVAVDLGIKRIPVRRA